MLRKFFATTALLGLSSAAFASVSMSVSAVDASSLGADYWGADVNIATSPSSDDWTVAGITGGTVNGATQNVVLDPNTGAAVQTAPGTANQLVTFVSLPRPATANARFTVAASIAGGFDPVTPVADLDTDSINIAWLEFPPVSTTPDTGAIARIVIHNGGAFAGNAVYISTTGPANPGDVLLGEYRAASGTVDVPSPLASLTFGFYTVPEPATLALLALGGLAAIRRR